MADSAICCPCMDVCPDAPQSLHAVNNRTELWVSASALRPIIFTLRESLLFGLFSLFLELLSAKEGCIFISNKCNYKAMSGKVIMIFVWFCYILLKLKLEAFLKNKRDVSPYRISKGKICPDLHLLAIPLKSCWLQHSLYYDNTDNWNCSLIPYFLSTLT